MEKQDRFKEMTSSVREICDFMNAKYERPELTVFRNMLKRIHGSPTGKPTGIYFDSVLNRPYDCHTLCGYEADE